MQTGACIFGGVTGHAIPAAYRLVLQSELALYDKVLKGDLMAKGIGEKSDGRDVELGLKWWDTNVPTCPPFVPLWTLEMQPVSLTWCLSVA